MICYSHMFSACVLTSIDCLCSCVLAILCSCCRKESLRLLRKMCRYVSPQWLSELCEEVGDPQRPTFPAQISEVLATVMESEVHLRKPGTGN